MYLTYKMIIRHEEDKNYNIQWVKVETDWLKILIYTGLIICLSWLIAITITVKYNLDKSYIFYPMWLVMSFLIYFIGHTGLEKSKQLKKRIELRKKRISNIQQSKKGTTNNSDTFLKFEQLLIQKQYYINPNLSIAIVAKELDLTESYLSQLIKKCSGTNFTEYVNTLRINETKRMLADDAYSMYTITAIGLEAGFNSKSSFYSVFKKHTNTTPNAYKKQVQDS